MKSGYDDFFKKARQASGSPQPQRSAKRTQKRAAPSTSFSFSEPTTDARLNEILRSARVPKKKSRGVNWKFIVMSVAGIAAAAIGMVYVDQIENFLKRVEVSVLGSAWAEEPAKKGAPKTEPAPAPEVKLTKTEYSQDEINHFVKLNDRKRELDAREEELARQEAEFQAQKAELERRLQELEKTRQQISSVLEERVKGDDQKVETLVQMYSNMKPVQAAKVFENMDEDLAVEIIGRMKKKNSAEIMNLIKPEKAQLFSEKFAGYRRGTISRAPAEASKNNATKEGGN